MSLWTAYPHPIKCLLHTSGVNKYLGSSRSRLDMDCVLRSVYQVAG
jgi:hypothetical protein